MHDLLMKYKMHENAIDLANKLRQNVVTIDPFILGGQ